MKKIFLLLSLFLSVMTTFAQSDFDRSKDKESGAVVFKGQCSFEDLKAEESFGWLQRGADDYKPDSATIQYLKKYLPQYELVVIMGTWCEDSHNLLPKLFKTLQLTGYPMAQYKMYGVDRAKEAKYVEHKLYRIELVPTFILMKNYMEIGRITETVHKSVEKDLAELIEKDQREKL